MKESVWQLSNVLSRLNPQGSLSSFSPYTVLFGVCLSILLFVSPTFATPTAVVTQPVHDFATVKEGVAVEHDYTIANEGSSTLEIKKILPSCGCTAAVVSSEKIRPGESTKLKVRFDTAGFRGYKVKNVRVYTNDPLHSSLVLTLQGTVQPPIVIEPARINFGKVRKGNGAVQEVVISPGVSAATIRAARPRSEFIKVDQNKRGDDTLLRVQLANNAPIGVFRSRVAVQTDSKETPLLNIPVFAKIQGDFSFSTPAVSFGLIQAPITEPVRKEVELSNESDTEIVILSAQSDHPNVTVEVQPIVPGKKFRVTVGLSGGHVGALRAKIKITTNHEDPAQKELILPVYGILSRSLS